MLDKILAVEGYPKYMDLPDVVVYALLGFGIVFFGICFLIGVVQLVSYLMKKFNGQTAVENKTSKVELPKEELAIKETSETIPDEVVAVITAALMAYYEQNNPKCEFTVRRIKKI